MDAPEDLMLFVGALDRIQELGESAARRLSALNSGMLFWNLLIAGAVLFAGADRVALFWAGFFGNLLWLYLHRRYIGLVASRQAFSRALGLEPEKDAGKEIGGVLPASLAFLYLSALFIDSLFR